MLVRVIWNAQLTLLPYRGVPADLGSNDVALSSRGAWDARGGDGKQGIPGNDQRDNLVSVPAAELTQSSRLAASEHAPSHPPDQVRDSAGM